MPTVPLPAATLTPPLVGPAFGADAGASSSSRLSAVLPPDLLEQVRGRVRLLADLPALAWGEPQAAWWQARALAA